MAEHETGWEVWIRCVSGDVGKHDGQTVDILASDAGVQGLLRLSGTCKALRSSIDESIDWEMAVKRRFGAKSSAVATRTKDGYGRCLEKMRRWTWTENYHGKIVDRENYNGVIRECVATYDDAGELTIVVSTHDGNLQSFKIGGLNSIIGGGTHRRTSLDEVISLETAGGDYHLLAATGRGRVVVYETTTNALTCRGARDLTMQYTLRLDEGEKLRISDNGADVDRMCAASDSLIVAVVHSAAGTDAVTWSAMSGHRLATTRLMSGRYPLGVAVFLRESGPFRTSAVVRNQGQDHQFDGRGEFLLEWNPLENGAPVRITMLTMGFRHCGPCDLLDDVFITGDHTYEPRIAQIISKKEAAHMETLNEDEFTDGESKSRCAYGKLATVATFPVPTAIVMKKETGTDVNWSHLKKNAAIYRGRYVRTAYDTAYQQGLRDFGPRPKSKEAFRSFWKRCQPISKMNEELLFDEEDRPRLTKGVVFTRLRDARNTVSPERYATWFARESCGYGAENDPIPDPPSGGTWDHVGDIVETCDFDEQECRVVAVAGSFIVVVQAPEYIDPNFPGEQDSLISVWDLSRDSSLLQALSQDTTQS